MRSGIHLLHERVTMEKWSQAGLEVPWAAVGGERCGFLWASGRPPGKVRCPEGLGCSEHCPRARVCLGVSSRGATWLRRSEQGGSEQGRTSLDS